ncbi:MAG TPA: mercuric transporter MerT family protein [Bacteroidota bacterium]|nr:mercuric transporter MerT family protein [Bacteroidota bacterium]
MNNDNFTATGAVVTAIIASLCCIGPIAVAMIGVGSITAFSMFWDFRPYLIGLTIVLLGIAFSLTYRKREVVCEDGTCKFESASTWSKGAVWLAALIALLAIAFPYVGPTNTAVAQSMLAQQPQEMTRSAVAVLEIEGMDCKGCVKGLEATLGRADGVRKAAVEFEKRRAVVEFDSTKISLQRLIAVVDETGFKAKPVNSNTDHN